MSSSSSSLTQSDVRVQEVAVHDVRISQHSKRHLKEVRYRLSRRLHFWWGLVHRNFENVTVICNRIFTYFYGALDQEERNCLLHRNFMVLRLRLLLTSFDGQWDRPESSHRRERQGRPFCNRERGKLAQAAEREKIKKNKKKKKTKSKLGTRWLTTLELEEVISWQ